MIVLITSLMEFCELCESRLTKKKNEEGSYMFYCRKCDKVYDSPLVVDSPNKSTGLKSKIDNKKISKFLKNKTVIIDKDDDTNLGNVIDSVCPDCNNDKAFFFELPPWYGDEDNIVRYKCTKCGNTYTDGGKTL